MFEIIEAKNLKELLEKLNKDQREIITVIRILMPREGVNHYTAIIRKYEK